MKTLLTNPSEVGRVTPCAPSRFTNNGGQRSARPTFTRLALAALASIQLRLPRKSRIALPNDLGLMTEHGKETLQIDPTSTFPTGSRWYLYRRGSAYNYGILANGVALPLGPSPDAPYQTGDLLSIYRLGIKPGSMLGIPTANAAITQDDLVYDAGATTPGCVADLTLAGNGTYWIVGRCLRTAVAGATEVAYAPCTPYQITVSGGGGTYAYAGAGK